MYLIVLTEVFDSTNKGILIDHYKAHKIDSSKLEKLLKALKF